MSPPLKMNGTPVLLKYRVDQLEKWRGEAEEHLEETDARVAGLNDKRIKIEADVKQLDEALIDLTKQTTSTNNWLRGIAGSLLVALVLLVIDLMRHH